MIKKLSKHGNSLALVIDKPILKLLKFDENTKSETAIEDGALVIRPISDNQIKLSSHDREKLIKEAAEKIMDQYEEAFKELAK